MKEKEIFKNAFRLLFLLVLVFCISAVSGGFMTQENLNWYRGLPLSPLTPPDIVFGIVWSVLYVFMAISAFLVWGKTSPRYFVFQLICNGFWPFIFFYLHSPVGGLVTIIAMLVFLGLTIKQFFAVSRVATWLLVPIFIWGLFALYLNAHIVWFL